MCLHLHVSCSENVSVLPSTVDEIFLCSNVCTDAKTYKHTLKPYGPWKAGILGLTGQICIMPSLTATLMLTCTEHWGQIDTTRIPHSHLTAGEQSHYIISPHLGETRHDHWPLGDVGSLHHGRSLEQAIKEGAEAVWQAGTGPCVNWSLLMLGNVAMLWHTYRSGGAWGTA